MGLNFNPLPIKILSQVKSTLDKRVENRDNVLKRSLLLPYAEREKLHAELVSDEDDSIVPGDEILKRLRYYIRQKKHLSKQQLLFTELYIHALLQYIYGEDFKTNELRIMVENFIEKIFQIALICCPRRFGKTYITSWFVACLVAAVPGVRATVFSPSKRQSIQVMVHVRNGFNELAKAVDLKYEIVKGKDNQEQFAIIIDGTERIVKGLPAKENTVRGVDADFAVLDEAAATPQHFFTHVILPVAIPSKSALVALSTIKQESDDGEENWFTTMMSLRDEDGSPMFSTFKFVLACEACTEKGLESSCIHRLGELPHWHNKSKYSMYKVIFKGLGEEETMLVENIGIAKKKTKSAFSQKSILRTFNIHRNPPVLVDELKEPPPFVFTFIDPAAAGKRSDLAIVSLFKLKGEYVFCGMDTIPVELTAVYTTDILNHLKRIRTLSHMRNVIIVIAIESNMGMNVNDIVAKILDPNEGIPNVVILSRETFEESTSGVNLYQGKRTREGTLKEVGLVTRGEIKLEAFEYFRDLLDTGLIRFYAECFTSYRPNINVAESENHTNVKLQLKQQLLNMAVVSKTTNGDNPAFQELMFTVSSKNKGKDDLAVASKLACRAMKKFLICPAYQRGIEHLIYQG